MKKNRITALLLASALALPAAGCSMDDMQQKFEDFFDTSEPEEGDGRSRTEVTPEEASVYVENAGHIFNHTSYTREMFYGKYTADGVVNTEMSATAKASFLENAETFTITGTHARLTAMPYRIDFGPHCNVTPLNYLSGYEWALLYYYDAQGNSVQVSAAYSVDGNALNFQLIRNFDYNSDAGTLNYEFSSDTIRYYYTLNGDGLMLSNSSGKITLYPEELHGDTITVNVNQAGLSPDSKQIEGIDSICLTADEQYVIVEGERCEVTGYELSENGLFKLRWKSADGTDHAIQTAYLYCDDDGIILLDEMNTYFYNTSPNDLYTKKVSTNLSVADSEALQNMSAAEIDALQTEVTTLYSDLEAAFKEAGVDATVDAETGEVALKSVVLFAVDDYFISEEGKEVLSRFLKAYTAVIFSDKYDGFVSQIVIEGHTDPTGLQYHNEVLSQARADQVKDFCLADNNGLPAQITEKLAPMLSSVGYAAAHPVFKPDGDVDLEGSRRVSFRFMVDLKTATAAE